MPLEGHRPLPLAVPFLLSGTGYAVDARDADDQAVEAVPVAGGPLGSSRVENHTAVAIVPHTPRAVR